VNVAGRSSAATFGTLNSSRKNQLICETLRSDVTVY
jgi:hypothetical protein